MIDLIFFDCDGVLVDSEVVGNRVFAEYLSAQGYPHTSQQCNAKYLGMSHVHVLNCLKIAGGASQTLF